MKARAIFLSVLGLAALGFAEIPATTPAPQSTDPNNWWYARFLEKSAYLKENGAPTLLVGDDQMELWEDEGKGQSALKTYLLKKPYYAYVTGYSADTTENVLWRLENGELEGYQPQAVVIMAGGNNTISRDEAAEPPCDTVLGVRKLIDTVKQRAPGAKIVLCAILPCGRGPEDPRRARNAVVNDALRGFCDGRDIFWCEVNNQLMSPDGVFGEDFSYDGVHLNANAYKVWARTLVKILDAVFKPDETPDLEKAESRDGERWWYERFLQIRVDAFACRSMHPTLTFFGDDLADGWTNQGMGALTNCFPRRVYLNAGIAGDALPQLNWRVRTGCLNTFRTTHLIVQAGLMNEDAGVEEYLAAYTKMVQECVATQSKAKVYVMAIPPRGERPTDPQRERIAAINLGLAALADNQTVFFIDCNDKLVDAQGFIPKWLSDDAIHYKAGAYEIWGRALAEYIMK